MYIPASSVLTSYAYQAAGGGAAGVLAAWNAARSAGLSAAALVGGDGADATGQAAALGAAGFGLAEAAGQGNQALQDLLRMGPDLGLLLPGAPEGQGNPALAGAEARYAYLQALRAGQGRLYTDALTTAAGTGAPGVTQLLASSQLPVPVAPAEEPPSQPAEPSPLTAFRAAPQDADGNGFVSALERTTYAFQHPVLDPADADQNGFVSPVERQAYALAHPAFDPADANGDGFVSFLEAQAYAQDHPASGFDTGVRTATVDTYA